MRIMLVCISNLSCGDYFSIRLFLLLRDCNSPLNYQPGRRRSDCRWKPEHDGGGEELVQSQSVAPSESPENVHTDDESDCISADSEAQKDIPERCALGD